MNGLRKKYTHSKPSIFFFFAIRDDYNVSPQQAFLVRRVSMHPVRFKKISFKGRIYLLVGVNGHLAVMALHH